MVKLSCNDINRNIEDFCNLQDCIDMSSCSCCHMMCRASFAPAVNKLSCSTCKAVSYTHLYASYEDGHGAEKICRQVFLHEDCCRKYRYHGNGKKNILIYAGDLDLNGITTVLYSCLLYTSRY